MGLSIQRTTSNGSIDFQLAFAQVKPGILQICLDKTSRCFKQVFLSGEM